LRRRLSICLEIYADVFLADIYAILACAYEIHMDVRPEKYVSIFSDSQGALEALEADKITSSLVQQGQKALNDILTKHSVGLFWVPGHSRVCGNEIADKPTRDGTVCQLVGHELALGIPRQNIRKKIKC
jgi:hypothetical protein